MAVLCYIAVGSRPPSGVPLHVCVCVCVRARACVCVGLRDAYGSVPLLAGLVLRRGSSRCMRRLCLPSCLVGGPRRGRAGCPCLHVCVDVRRGIGLQCVSGVANMCVLYAERVCGNIPGFLFFYRRGTVFSLFAIRSRAAKKRPRPTTTTGTAPNATQEPEVSPCSQVPRPDAARRLVPFLALASRR